MIFELPQILKDAGELWPLLAGFALLLLAIFGGVLYLRSFVRKDANDANVDNVEALKKLNETYKAEISELAKGSAERDIAIADLTESIDTLKSELAVVSGIIVSDVILAAKKIDEKEIAMMQMKSDINILTIQKDALEKRIAELRK